MYSTSTACFTDLCNPEMVFLEDLVEDADVADVRRMIEDHLAYTGSSNAKRVLENWDEMLPLFVKVMPIDYKRALAERAERIEREESAAVTFGD